MESAGPVQHVSLRQCLFRGRGVYEDHECLVQRHTTQLFPMSMRITCSLLARVRVRFIHTSTAIASQARRYRTYSTDYSRGNHGDTWLSTSGYRVSHTSTTTNFPKNEISTRSETKVAQYFRAAGTKTPPLEWRTKLPCRTSMCTRISGLRVHEDIAYTHAWRIATCQRSRPQSR